ncbi:MAG TPA: hypothetical protein VF235_04630 [Actinomycetota bacterium]
MTDDESPARGSVLLYLLAFAALVVAAGFLGYAAARDFLKHLELLWISVGASVVAIVLALLSVVWNRRV